MINLIYEIVEALSNFIFLLYFHGFMKMNIFVNLLKSSDLFENVKSTSIFYPSLTFDPHVTCHFKVVRCRAGTNTNHSGL